MPEIQRTHMYSPETLSPELRLYAREMYPPEVLTALVVVRFASETLAGLSGKKIAPLQISDLDFMPRDQLLRIGASALEYLIERAAGSTFYDNNVMILGPWPGTGKTTTAMRIFNEFRDTPVMHLNTYESFEKDHIEITSPSQTYRPPTTIDDLRPFVLSKLNETLSILFRLRKRPKNEHVFIGGITQRLGALAAYLGLFDRDQNGHLIIPKHWEKLQLIHPLEPYSIVFVDSPLEQCLARAREQAIEAIKAKTPNRSTPITEQEIAQEYAWAKRAAPFRYAMTIREYTLTIMEKMKEYSEVFLHTPLPLYTFLNYDIREYPGYYESTRRRLERSTSVFQVIPELTDDLRRHYNPTKLNMWLDQQERMMGGPPLVPRIINRRTNHQTGWHSSGIFDNARELANILQVDY